MENNGLYDGENLEKDSLWMDDTSVWPGPCRPSLTIGVCGKTAVQGRCIRVCFARIRIGSMTFYRCGLSLGQYKTLLLIIHAVETSLEQFA